MAGTADISGIMHSIQLYKAAWGMNMFKVKVGGFR
jgi:hypothetical protein